MNFKSLCLSCGIEGVMGLLKDAGLLKLGRGAQNPSDFYAIKWALIGFLTHRELCAGAGGSILHFVQSRAVTALYFLIMVQIKSKARCCLGQNQKSARRL